MRAMGVLKIPNTPKGKVERVKTPQRFARRRKLSTFNRA